MNTGAGCVRPSTAIAVIAVLAGALTAGCGQAPAGSPSRPLAASVAAATPTAATVAPLAAGDGAVPKPTGPVVLTLTGLVGATNGDRSLRFDAAGLDRIGLQTVEVYEPWVKQNLTFQGIWLADLMKVARPDQTARMLRVTALDDYQIDLTTADVRAGGIFVATKRGDGTPIPVEDGGPTRIVFVGGVASGKRLDQWIWSLKTIDVR